MRVADPDGMVEMSETRFLELEDAERKLNAFEAAGVDNWQGYDDAMDIYREFVEEDKED